MSDTDTRFDNGVAGDELRAFIERIERLEEEKAGIAGDIKEVFAELKGRGFDTKAVRSIIRIRKQDHAERQEQEAILELYMEALGMLADTPLGRAAAGRTFGDDQVERAARKAAADPSVRKAVAAFGTRVEMTDAERERGTVAAFERDGHRMSIQIPGVVADAVPAKPVVPPTLEESERLIAAARSLKGTTVRLDHFGASPRRLALQALALSKGASVILGGGEVIEPEKPKRTRKGFQEKIAERAAAVAGNPVAETAMPAEPELADA